MKERPIIFSAPMVRAILSGAKTQTRRVVKPQPFDRSWSRHDHRIGYTTDDEGIDLYAYSKSEGGEWHARCPYGKPGDRLWVRETWRYTASTLEESRAITEDITGGIAVDWRATYIGDCMKQLGFSREDAEMADDFETWRPSIHMPRWASRITLEIVGVRVERLQDISEADCIAEGIASAPGGWWSGATGQSSPTPVGAYALLWESINGPGSWALNPWVWVIEFKRLP